jgi:FkbM family methyltransferase
MWQSIEHKATGGTFMVLEPEVQHAARFWYDFASGAWEPKTLERVASLLKQGVLAAEMNPRIDPPLFFDIGAWVGPYTLMAADLGARVLALEPDPEARKQLEANVGGNIGFDAGGNMLLPPPFPMILANALNDRAPAIVYLQMDEPGDSMSSMTRQNLRHVIEVAAVTIDDLIASFGEPDLVKIDIEGGECIVVPAAGPTLRELQVPMVLSLHPQWYQPERIGPLMAELQNWYCEQLDPDTYLCTPRAEPAGV